MGEIFEVYDPKASAVKIARRHGFDGPNFASIYSLKVYPEEKPDQNQLIIEIRGDQNLNDLRKAIEPAFGRDCDYGFMIAGVTQDNEIDIECYGSIGQDDREAAIETFSAGDRFTYVLFPAPGQDLVHIVEVEDVRRERQGAGVYPRVLAKPSPVGDGLSDNVVSTAERKKPEKVYTFKVYLGRKLKKRPRPPWRLIAIRGDQTLDDLHEAIYEAFDRWDEHLYSFYIGEVDFTVLEEEPGPMSMLAQFMGGTPERDATKAVVDGLGLSAGDWFTYLFDFGDEWWHVVELVSVEEKDDDGTVYPVVVEKRGESPEQYPDSGDEWDE